MDKSNGRKYIGSAYNTGGIWSRWKQYANTGHGGNIGLTEIDSFSISYARENFKITLIEAMSFKTGDDFIIERKCFWKKALLTGKDFGYNKN